MSRIPLDACVQTASVRVCAARCGKRAVHWTRSFPHPLCGVVEGVFQGPTSEGGSGAFGPAPIFVHIFCEHFGAAEAY